MVFLIFGALAALLSHVAVATSAFGFNYFDQPLRLLQAVYAARDLTPYADYGFVYLPGYAWFYGKLLRLQEPESAIAAIALVNLLLVVVCAQQLMRLAPSRAWLYGGVVLLILGGAIPIASPIIHDQQALILLAIVVLLLVSVMLRGPSIPRVIILISAAAAATLFRWDWILAVAVLEAGGAAGVWLAMGRMDLKNSQIIEVRQTAARLWVAAVTTLAGVGLAMGVTLGYALATNTWADTRLFVFYLPLLIKSIGTLSLPRGVGWHLQLLVEIIAMMLIALAALLACVNSRARHKFVYLLEGGALLFPCIALLPYAFGSDNFSHFLPLSVLVIMSSLIALTLWPPRAPQWLLVAALGLAASPTLSLAFQRLVHIGGIPQADVHLEETRRATSACTDLFPPDAVSLFLGQISYDGFPSNYPVLYLMRPDLRPATPFISDERGVQSSCAFGSRIAADLKQAPRPLVIVLDTTPWNRKKYLTRGRHSCGKIEAVLATMSGITLGACRLAGRTYQVSVVR